MSKLTGETNKFNLGKSDLSGRPEGVTDEEWKKILDAARNQVIAERSDVNEISQSQADKLREVGTEEHNLVGVVTNSGSQKETVAPVQIVETNERVADFRKEVLERALNILNNSTGASADDLRVDNPDGVAAFVERLNNPQLNDLDIKNRLN